MTIEEVFTEEDITIQMIADRSDESGSSYWENCYNFVNENGMTRLKI